MFQQLPKGVRDALDFSGDVLGNWPKICIVGRENIVVENFLEIITFTEQEIRMDTAEGELCLRGEGFMVRTLLPTEMKVEGRLTSLTFRGGAG